MIITILPNSTNFHAVAYNEHKVEQGFAELIEVKNFLTLRKVDYSADNFRQYLEDFSSQNTRIKSAQFHVSVSCKGTEHTFQQLLDIAHRYLKEMGYADEGQALLVYAHHDTPNNHIHIITSRINLDGKKINDKFEKRRSLHVTKKIMEKYTGKKQELTPNDVAAAALGYRYTSKAQYCAILESQGYECKDDEAKPIIHLYRGGAELGIIEARLIMQHALRENAVDEKRRRQLRAILLKYRNLSANKEEFAAVMKRKFGISLVYLGKKDSPYGYFVVDHKNKTVHKGSEFVSIKEFLQFEDTATRFAKIQQTIDTLLQENPNLTTSDLNRVLYRQFGTRIHQGSITWNGQTINLKNEVQEQLHRNNRVALGLPAEHVQVIMPQPKPEPKCQPSRPHSNSSSFLNAPASASATSHEHEVNITMDLDIDDEQHQKMKWRR